MTTPQRGIPGWAIGLIVGIGALLIVMLIGGLLGLRALGVAISEATPPRHPQVTEEPSVPPLPETSDPAEPESDLLAQAEEDAEYVIELHEQYLAARTDGSITDDVPGGSQVDPDYIAAFLYAITDLRSAVRFVPPSVENAEQLREYAEEAREYERLFLAGEDLDIDIKITREDGSVFETDGKYRTIKP